MSVSPRDLRQRWEAAGQGHVFGFWDELNCEQQEKLLRQLRSIDVDLVNKIYTSVSTRGKPAPVDVKPLPDVVKLSGLSEIDKKSLTDIGINAIVQGKVAVLLLAGGQGTRLNTSDPKGVYNVGLPSGKTLYELQGERIVKLQQLISEKTGQKEAIVPWYVMTSFATDLPTRQYFAKHNYFGLNKENIFFFNQDLFPCIFEDGKVIMKKKYKVQIAPNGNGGVWSALNTSGALMDMKRRGVTLLCSYPVDNILVRVADPLFVGFSIKKDLDISCKVVSKAYPTERVGVLALKGDRPAVIEYSEIDPERATAVDPTTGQLVYNASHLGLNNFSVRFIEKLVSPEGGRLHELPFHIAKKQIPYLDSDGVEKCDRLAWKLEMFVFDVFEYCEQERMSALEVYRGEEFSPLKNSDASDSDNPTTCRKHLSALHRGWIEKAGGQISDKSGSGLVEILPSVSLEGEGLEQLVAGKTFETPVFLK